MNVKEDIAELRKSIIAKNYNPSQLTQLETAIYLADKHEGYINVDVIAQYLDKDPSEVRENEGRRIYPDRHNFGEGEENQYFIKVADSIPGICSSIWCINDGNPINEETFKAITDKSSKAYIKNVARFGERYITVFNVKDEPWGVGFIQPGETPEEFRKKWVLHPLIRPYRLDEVTLSKKPRVWKKLHLFTSDNLIVEEAIQ